MSIKKIAYWLPRVLGTGFIIFLSLFALDVFNEYSGWDLVVALFMHLIPSLLLLLSVLVAWRYELVGTVIFLLFAFGYILLAGFDRPWSWYVSIFLPSALLGILFFISWFYKKH